MNNILMNIEMTKAILCGRKVQTRRVIKFGLYAIENDMNEHSIEVASNYCDLDEHNHPELKKEMIKHGKYKKDEAANELIDCRSELNQKSINDFGITTGTGY